MEERGKEKGRKTSSIANEFKTSSSPSGCLNEISLESIGTLLRKNLIRNVFSTTTKDSEWKCPWERSKLENTFFGGGEGAFGADEHEKVPWDGGRDHLELLVADATSQEQHQMKRVEVALNCLPCSRFSSSSPDLPHRNQPRIYPNSGASVPGYIREHRLQTFSPGS